MKTVQPSKLICPLIATACLTVSVGILAEEPLPLTNDQMDALSDGAAQIVWGHQIGVLTATAALIHPQGAEPAIGQRILADEIDLGTAARVSPINKGDHQRQVDLPLPKLGSLAVAMPAHQDHDQP